MGTENRLERNATVLQVVIKTDRGCGRSIFLFVISHYRFHFLIFSYLKLLYIHIIVDTYRGIVLLVNFVVSLGLDPLLQSEEYRNFGDKAHIFGTRIFTDHDGAGHLEH